MNIGTAHVCIEAFHGTLCDNVMDLETLRTLNMVNKEWHMATTVPLKQKKLDYIRRVLGCVDKDGICRIGKSTMEFSIGDTKLRIDPLCQFAKCLVAWRTKSLRQRIPDYSILFSESLFDLQKHPDDDTEIEIVMNTMRLLIAGTNSCGFEDHPASQLCWLYLMCNFILKALKHGLYPELFNCRTFAAVILHKLKTYRGFLRSNVRKIPDRLRYHLISMFDDLETEYSMKIA